MTTNGLSHPDFRAFEALTGTYHELTYRPDRQFHFSTRWKSVSLETRMKAAPLALALSFAIASLSLHAQPLTLNARSQKVAPDDRKKQYKVTESVLMWEPRETAIVVCDMWDQHWCRGATRRVAEMAPHMNEVVAIARARGVLIVHCPSGVVDFYQNTPMRRLAQQAPKVDTKIPLQRWCYIDSEREAPLPIDDSDGGCDCEPRCKTHSPWTRQIATIEIKDGDAVTDTAEAYYLMRQRGVKNVIVMGVHLNMCVLGRPFSIRQMIYQGQQVVLMRDMTDTMYNPRMSPFVSHFSGNRLVTQHVERHWAPTVTSSDFTGRPEFRFKDDK